MYSQPADTSFSGYYLNEEANTIWCFNRVAQGRVELFRTTGDRPLQQLQVKQLGPCTSDGGNWCQFQWQHDGKYDTIQFIWNYENMWLNVSKGLGESASIWLGNDYGCPANAHVELMRNDMKSISYRFNVNTPVFTDNSTKEQMRFNWIDDELVIEYRANASKPWISLSTKRRQGYLVEYEVQFPNGGTKHRIRYHLHHYIEPARIICYNPDGSVQTFSAPSVIPE